MPNRHLIVLSLLIFLFSSAYAETFRIDVYKNSKCEGKMAGPDIMIDTTKSCNSYSYVDSKGMTINGSQNNIRCYKDKVVFDQFPFSGKCLASESYYQGKQYVEKNHTVKVGVCQESPSHDGPVYEKLSGYSYPGNEECA